MITGPNNGALIREMLDESAITLENLEKIRATLEEIHLLQEDVDV